jgi:hypothetical protein
MKRWVITGTIDANKLKGVLSGRFLWGDLAGSVMFVAYSRFLRQWYLCANSTEEVIPEPQMIFVDEQWARDNVGSNPVQLTKPTPIRKKEAEQLNLF